MRRKKAPRKPGSIRAKRRARSREAILKAGLKVFAQKGYKSATMDDIALQLDATKGLLYYHFRTKDEILSAILTENEMIRGIEAGMAAPEGVPLGLALRLAVQASLALMEANRELVRFLHVQALLSGEEAEIVYNKVLDRLYDRSAQWLEPFKQTGEVRPDVNTRHWGRLLVDLITNHFLQGQIFGEHGESQQEQLEGMLEILLQGIAVLRPSVRPAAATGR